MKKAPVKTGIWQVRLIAEGKSLSASVAFQSALPSWFLIALVFGVRWADFKDLAAAHHLSACCSMPIFSLEGKVLGTVAMYDPQPHNTGEHDRLLIERARHLAAIIIERKQADLMDVSRVTDGKIELHRQTVELRTTPFSSRSPATPAKRIAA